MKRMFTVTAILNTLSELEHKNKKEFQNSPELRMFILISSVMTWAMTKPVDPVRHVFIFKKWLLLCYKYFTVNLLILYVFQDDPDLPFTDSDFQKRRAHPNYKAHLQLEKEILKLGKKVDITNKRILHM